MGVKLNSKKMKIIRRRAKTILVQWLKSLLPDDEKEKEKITEKTIFSLMPTQTHHVFQNQIRLSAWSFKWVVKQLKKNPDLTFNQLDDIIKNTNMSSHKVW